MTESHLTRTRELRMIAKAYDLEAPPAFWSASDAEVDTIYNGTGPEWFPESLRHILDEIMVVALPAVVIHDWEFSHNDGSLAMFEKANARLYINVKRLASAAYPLSDPFCWIIRAKWMIRAWIMWRSCSDLGWSAYESGKGKLR